MGPNADGFSGSAGAIGQAHAECFAVAGARLVLTYNRTPPADTLKQRCESLGASQVTFVQCDVSNQGSIEKLISEVCCRTPYPYPYHQLPALLTLETRFWRLLAAWIS